MRSDTSLGHAWSMDSDEARERYYDAWASKYDADLLGAGYRVPAVASAVFARFVPLDARPILDAGCGTGLQTEGLALAGFGPFVGIDLSDGMLGIARSKGIYAELHKMALGGHLDFGDGHFAASYTTGTITPNHAPPESIDDIIRVTRKGGRIVLSLRVDADQLPAYPARLAHHEEAGRWRLLFETPTFHSMPITEPEIAHRVFVYEVL